jgi:hypothetical protein
MLGGVMNPDTLQGQSTPITSGENIMVHLPDGKDVVAPELHVMRKERLCNSGKVSNCAPKFSQA